MKEHENPPGPRSAFAPFLLLALVLAVVAFVRIRLLSVPLERDEGEFAYMGQLLLKGIPPFTHAYTMKLPGVSIVYAFFMSLCGQTAAGIHLGLLVVNATCILLVYLLTKRLFDRNAAMFSCSCYAVLSLSNSVYGVFAHATHFVVMFALAGFILLLRSLEKRQILPLIISGLCFGLAITMKQHAVMLVIFAVLYFIRRVWRNPLFDKKLCVAGSLLFLIGTIIPYALILLWMVRNGSFDTFWFWTVLYANEYTSNWSLAAGWTSFTYSFGKIARLLLPMWLLAGFGLVLLFTKKRWCHDRLFVIGFFFFSFLSVCPGLIFREHYFVLLLPAVAIMSGAGVNSAGHFFMSSASTRFTPFIPVFLLVAAIAYNFYLEQDNYFFLTPQEVSRAIYTANPFPEALQIASYIKNDTSPDERIAVLGSEPEIYFYADRLSATGHIYMFGLMEKQPYAELMQSQMIREIEAARPKYVVVVNVNFSWFVQKSSIRSVFYWEESYVRKWYDLVGVIDIIDPKTTLYLWGNEATNYVPVSKCFVTVFKRKKDV